jgi:hypothetical protein
MTGHVPHLYKELEACYDENPRIFKSLLCSGTMKERFIEWYKTQPYGYGNLYIRAYINFNQELKWKFKLFDYRNNECLQSGNNFNCQEDIFKLLPSFCVSNNPNQYISNFLSNDEKL